MEIRFKSFKVLNPIDETVIGRVTAAIKKNNDDTSLVSFAFCSPKDRYDKKHGQVLAFAFLIHKQANKRLILSKVTNDSLKEAIIDFAELRNIQWVTTLKNPVIV